MTNFDRVRKFMETFGQEVKKKAEFPNEKIIALRYDLIKEELEELKLAIDNNDIKEVADALTDILYGHTVLDMLSVLILINVLMKFKTQI